MSYIAFGNEQYRAFFAAFVAAGMCANPTIDASNEEIATVAFAIADELMEERNKK